MPIDAEQWRAQTGLFCASRVLLRPPRYKQPKPKVQAETLSVNMEFSLAVLLVTLRTGVSYVSRTLQLLWLFACNTSWLLSSIVRLSCKRLRGASVLLALCLVVVPMLLIMSGDVEENPGPPKIQAMDLSIDDLAIIYEETFTARSSWYSLGLVLQVPVSTLDDIDGRSRDPKDLLCEVLKAWLRRARKPTWQSLVDALDNPIVDEPRLARTLQEKYCTAAVATSGPIGYTGPSGEPGTRVKKEALPRLVNLLSPVVHSWKLFAEQIGVPTSQVSQIRALAFNAPTGPSYLYTCLYQALMWWVANHHNPTYEAIIAVLDPEMGQTTPVMNRYLASEVKRFMAKEQQVAVSSAAATSGPSGPSVEPANLTVYDLGMVLEELYEALTCWYCMGLELRMKVSILDSISSQWSHPEECFRRMLMVYLQTAIPSPSWRALVEALRSPVVGFPRLAERVEQRHCQALQLDVAVSSAAATSGPSGPSVEPASSMGVSDLSCVREELLDVRYKWFDIGLELRLSVGTLERIRDQYTSPSTSLREVLLHWLKKVDPPPTWEGLACVLERRTVGEPWLAKQLRTKYCKTPQAAVAVSSAAATGGPSGPSVEPATPHPKENWQHQALSENSTAIIRALAANKLSEPLADQLKARKMIGNVVYASATNYGPDITEYTRMKHLISALLISIKSNPQHYHDFITVLQLDGIREDAKAALALLQTDSDHSHLSEEVKKQLDEALKEDKALSKSHLEDQTHVKIQTLPEVDFIDSISAKIYGKKELQVFNWKEHGFKLHIPGESLTEGDECEVIVASYLSGSFILPPNTTLMSAVFHIQTSKDFCAPVFLELEHCCIMPAEGNACGLVLASADTSTQRPPYTFSFVSGGSFLPTSKSGFISVSSFSYWIILYDRLFGDGQPPKYACRGFVFSYQEGSMAWKVILVIIKDLQAHIEAVKKLYSSFKKITDFTINFTDESHSIELDGLGQGGCITLDECWKICPYSDPVILRDAVEDFGSKHHVPAKCELSVTWQKEDRRPKPLEHTVKLKGSQQTFFMFRVDPTVRDGQKSFMNDFCVWLCYFSGWFMMAVMVVLGLLYMYLFQSNFAGGQIMQCIWSQPDGATTPSARYPPANVTPKDFTHFPKPTLQHLNSFLGSEVAAKWELIGDNLGLKNNELSSIRSNNAGYPEQNERCLRDVFIRWCSGKTVELSWKKITEILFSLSEDKAVNELYKKLKQKEKEL